MDCWSRWLLKDSPELLIDTVKVNTIREKKKINDIIDEIIQLFNERRIQLSNQIDSIAKREIESINSSHNELLKKKHRHNYDTSQFKSNTNINNSNTVNKQKLRHEPPSSNINCRPQMQSKKDNLNITMPISFSLTPRTFKDKIKQSRSTEEIKETYHISINKKRYCLSLHPPSWSTNDTDNISTEINLANNQCWIESNQDMSAG
eukprot:147081_1